MRSGGTERFFRTAFRNKAHTRMYRETLGHVSRGEAALYRPRDLAVVSAIQIAASDLVRTAGATGQIPSWLDDVSEIGLKDSTEAKY